jgi:hypothetical protein
VISKAKGDLWHDYIIVGDEAWTREEWAAIPHGTRTGYIGHACRCERCRAWRRAYYAQPRRRVPA